MFNQQRTKLLIDPVTKEALGLLCLAPRHTHSEAVGTINLYPECSCSRCVLLMPTVCVESRISAALWPTTVPVTFLCLSDAYFPS